MGKAFEIFDLISTHTDRLTNVFYGMVLVISSGHIHLGLVSHHSATNRRDSHIHLGEKLVCITNLVYGMYDIRGMIKLA